MNREDLHRSIHYVQKVLFPLALVTFGRDGSGRSKILKKRSLPDSVELHAPAPVPAPKTMPILRVLTAIWMLTGNPILLFFGIVLAK